MRASSGGKKLLKPLAEQLMPKSNIRGLSKRIVVTGGNSQIAQAISLKLRQTYGRENVLLTDRKWSDKGYFAKDPCKQLEPLDFYSFKRVVTEHETDWLIHFQRYDDWLLIGKDGQKYQENSLQSHSILNAIYLAKDLNLRLFIPSVSPDISQHLFLSSPLKNLPESEAFDRSEMNVSRLSGDEVISSTSRLDNLGKTYNRNFNLDYRSLQYPFTLHTHPVQGNEVNNFVIQMFCAALKGRQFKCGLNPNTHIHIMTLDDLVDSIVKFMEVPDRRLQKRTYSISGLTFTPQELADEIRKHIPDFDIAYYQDEELQTKVDELAQAVDDSDARRDWSHRQFLNITQLTNAMIKGLPALLNIPWRIDI